MIDGVHQQFKSEHNHQPWPWIVRRPTLDGHRQSGNWNFEWKLCITIRLVPPKLSSSPVHTIDESKNTPISTKNIRLREEPEMRSEIRPRKHFSPGPGTRTHTVCVMECVILEIVGRFWRYGGRTKFTIFCIYLCFMRIRTALPCALVEDSARVIWSKRSFGLFWNSVLVERLMLIHLKADLKFEHLDQTIFKTVMSVFIDRIYIYIFAIVCNFLF